MKKILTALLVCGLFMPLMSGLTAQEKKGKTPEERFAALDTNKDNRLNRYELEYYLHYKVLSLGYRYREVPVWKRYPTDGMPTSKIRLSRDYWSLLRPLVLLTLRLRT